MKMYIQWSKYDGYTSFFQKLIITRLPCFEKLALSQFKVYIKTETMTHRFVCCNFKKTIIIRSSKVKKVFCTLHMLSIHIGLRKVSKKNVFDLHLKNMNPFEIGKSCIIIARRELLFKQYRMALKREKYYIEVQNDDAIKCNQVLKG